MSVDVVKLSGKGQVTIPVDVRRALGLNAGDKVAFIEEEGKYYIANSARLAFQHVISAFSGAAHEAGFAQEEDMQDYVKEIRREVHNRP